MNSVKPNSQDMVIPSQALDHSSEGVTTTGGKMSSLNDQQERPTTIRG